MRPTGPHHRCIRGNRPRKADPLKHRLLSLFFAFEFMAMLGSSGVLAAEERGRPSESQAATSPLQSAPGPSDFAGAMTYAICHAAEAKGLGSSPHAKLALEHDRKGVTCKGCHGPGRAHVVSGDESNSRFTATKCRPRAAKDPCGGRPSACNRWIRERA